MSGYVLTNKAVEDLSEIWNYTVYNWSEQQADKYYSMLIDTFDEIARSPESGREYTGILSRYRGVKSGSHIIFYLKKDDTTIEIVRILHQQMDLKNRIIEK